MVDIAMALKLIETEIAIKKYRLTKDHLLPPKETLLKKEIQHLESATKKIKDKFNI